MKNAVLISLIVLLSSCLRLDDNLFNASELSEYKLDNYDGEMDFRLDATFDIPDSLVSIFTIESKGSDEANATVIFAMYLGNLDSISTDTVIMYYHGNRDHMDFYWQRAKLLANVGGKNRFGVLMIDYRGYGKSDGTPTENGLYADADAALNWLSTMGLTNDRLVVYGFSMGSAPATKMAAGNYSMHPSKLILEAPFSSAEVMVQDGSGLALPGEFVTDLKINNAEEIKSVSQPFSWIHGTADDFLKIQSHGEVVYANYQGTYKEAHRIINADHGTIQTTMGFEEYMLTVENFLIY